MQICVTLFEKNLIYQTTFPSAISDNVNGEWNNLSRVLESSNFSSLLHRVGPRTNCPRDRIFHWCSFDNASLWMQSLAEKKTTNVSRQTFFSSYECRFSYTHMHGICAALLAKQNQSQWAYLLPLTFCTTIPIKIGLKYEHKIQRINVQNTMLIITNIDKKWSLTNSWHIYFKNLEL